MRPDRLAEEDRAVAEAAARALELLEGARRFPRRPSEPVEIRVNDVISRTIAHEGVAFNIQDVTWEVVFRDDSVERFTLPLGAYLIEEGLAYLLEMTIRHGSLAFEEAWSLESGTPLFPYLAYQTLCRARAPGISAIAALRVGLMALNTNRPGDALVRTLDAYAQLCRTDANDERVCEALRDRVEPELGEIISRILRENLDHVPPLFADRGYVTEGIALVHQWFSQGLAARRNDIWFDIAWCSCDPLDAGLLLTMLRQSAPCDVIQGRVGDDAELGRDALITFRVPQDAATLRTLSGVRSLQAQLDYMLNHLKIPPGSGRDESWAAMSRTLPCANWRCERPTQKRGASAPWRLWNRDPTCWYGAAVAGTMGIVIQEGESVPQSVNEREMPANSDVEADKALGRCAPSGPCS